MEISMLNICGYGDIDISTTAKTYRWIDSLRHINHSITMSVIHHRYPQTTNQTSSCHIYPHR